MEKFYLASIFGSLLFYLQVSMNYRFSNKYLNLLEEKENFKLFPLAITFSLVCLFSAFYYFTDPSEQAFGYYFLILMFCVVLAKYYYFSSLRIFLGYRFPVDKIYFYLVCVYAVVSVYYFYQYSQVGLSAFFDLTKPETGESFLRKTLIPYAIKQEVKLFFIPNYLFSQIFYFYLIFVAIKKKEMLIAFGVVFTTLSILYTNSYHIFKWSIWMPMNMIADLFEMFRLHSVQKMKLSQKINHYNKKLNFVESKLKDLEESKQIFKHDLNNKFSVANLSLYKAKTLISKNEFENKEDVIHCIDNARTANKQAASFLKETGLISGSEIKQKTYEVLSLFDIENQIDIMELEGSFLETKYDNILTNLVKNALEATKGQSSPWIEVIGKQLNGKYNLKVIDSGIYKDIKEPTKIFENKYTSKTKDEEEHGFGLTSVLKDVKTLKGEIQLIDYHGNTCFDLNFKTAKSS